MPSSTIKKLLLLGVLSSGGGEAPATPVLTVTGNGQSIADGDVTPSAADNTDFGLSPSLTTVSKTFNLAVADANLTGVSVALSGAGAGGFTITDSPDATINAGANSDLSIRYDALSDIQYDATVTIASNEIDDITFAIRGSSLYSARVLATTPIAFWKLNDASGTTITDSSGNAYNGTYSGVDLANTASPVTGANAPFWDGTNDYGSLYSASFASAFNMDEGTVMIWLKVQGAGVWTDATNRHILEIQRNSNNLVRIQKTTTNNSVLFRRAGNATAKSVTVGSQSSTGWICYAISWSIAGGGLLSAGDTRAYVNGAQSGATQTGSAASAGSGLVSTVTVAGAATTTPTSVWNGYLSHVIVWNVPMTNAILALMTV